MSNPVIASNGSCKFCGQKIDKFFGHICGDVSRYSYLINKVNNKYFLSSPEAAELDKLTRILQGD